MIQLPFTVGNGKAIAYWIIVLLLLVPISLVDIKWLATGVTLVIIFFIISLSLLNINSDNNRTIKEIFFFVKYFQFKEDK